MKASERCCKCYSVATDIVTWRRNGTTMVQRQCTAHADATEALAAQAEGVTDFNRSEA